MRNKRLMNESRMSTFYGFKIISLFSGSCCAFFLSSVALLGHEFVAVVAAATVLSNT